ncbi:MAG: hypothetical protein RIA63_01285 [Cyclobacteriaceae bacterium]
MLLLFFCCGFVSGSYAQKDDEITFPLDNFYAKRVKSPLRTILKNVVFTGSIGYGKTFLSHKLEGFGISQVDGVQPEIFPLDSAVRFRNWVNQVSVDTVNSGPDSFTVSSDTSKLGFKGRAFNIPFRLTLHYEFLQRYRLGGGFSYELMNMGDLHSINYRNDINNFRPDKPTGFMKKYFFLVGVSFYRWNNILFTGDVNVGGYSPGKNFDKSLIKKGIYANAGVTIEQDFSEYLKVFVRPSFELKNYTLSVPGSGGNSIVHNLNAWYLNVGIAYRIPELPRCYHPDCHAQINHAHGNKEYRSRMHRFWKKQNPHYGENYPNLIKEKRKNRKKLNPY